MKLSAESFQIGLFGALLGCAGVPIYIHLPRFAAADLGISLSVVALVLIGIRIMDFVQDPILGRIIDRLPKQRGLLFFLAGFGLILGFLMVFSIRVPHLATPWLTVGLVVLLTSYSLGTLMVYGVGTGMAKEKLWQISTFREGGIVLGILIGAIAPQILGSIFGAEVAYVAFGYFVAVFALPALALADVVRRPVKISSAPKKIRLKFDRPLVRLLILSLFNSLPFALTSTLFLFFVEDHLAQTTNSGFFLLSFFVFAGFCIPLWSAISKRFGAKNTLTTAMILAIACFIFAGTLTPETAVYFWLICILSGAAVGADMVILPVLFTSALTASGQPAGQAFGLWFLTSKVSLVLASVIALPLLENAGFIPGTANAPDALALLVVLYAFVPCALKIISIVMVRTLPEEIFTK